MKKLNSDQLNQIATATNLTADEINQTRRDAKSILKAIETYGGPGEANEAKQDRLESTLSNGADSYLLPTGDSSAILIHVIRTWAAL